MSDGDAIHCGSHDFLCSLFRNHRLTVRCQGRGDLVIYQVRGVCWLSGHMMNGSMKIFVVV